jgi:hypothetical protein
MTVTRFLQMKDTQDKIKKNSEELKCNYVLLRQQTPPGIGVQR